MGLALVLGQTGEPFHKPLRDDVMWVVQYVRDRQLLGNVLAAEVTAAYAKAKLGNGWRAWDRVRQELRELGLAKTPPAGKGQDVRLELTETGLAVAVAGGEAR